jgi:hypothetical protein
MGYIDGLVTYLVSMIINLCYALFYPIYSIIMIFVNVINLIWVSFVSFINSLIGLFTAVYSTIYSLFYLIFPSSWVAVLLLGLSIAILLRVYAYLKDIEIFGFKI